MKSERILQIVLAPDLPLLEGPGVQTVFAFPTAETQSKGGFSARQFLAQGYEELGLELGRWWYRRFDLPDSRGKTLHGICAWRGIGLLWCTRALFLSPESGFFIPLLILAKALRELSQGTYSGVRCVGGGAEWAEVFEANGFSCERVPAANREAVPRSSLPRRIWQAIHRGFLVPWSWRLLGAPKAAMDPDRTLLYAVQIGEWETPEGGRHRYLGDAVAELLENGTVDRALPLVYGRPPLSGPLEGWEAHLEITLRRMGGIYPLGYAGPALAGRTSRWGKKVGERARAWLREAKESGEVFRWRGFDLSSWAARVVETGIQELAGRAYLYEVTVRALRKWRPRALLLKDEVYIHGRLLSAAARTAGVPTLALQHGSIYPTHWSYLLDPEAVGLAAPPLPDRFGVYGQRTVELLADTLGFPRGVLTVIGARRFRALDSAAVEERFRRVREEGRELVLVAGQLHADMPVLYDWCFELARTFPETYFVFKPHPRDLEGIERLESRCERGPNCEVYGGSLAGVLPAASLVISGHSTVLLEAIWLGIGGISVQISGEEEADWQREGGLLRVARDREELARCVRAALSGGLFSERDRARAGEYLRAHLGQEEARKKILELP
jgi:hypothetical protein